MPVVCTFRGLDEKIKQETRIEWGCKVELERASEQGSSLNRLT